MRRVGTVLGTSLVALSLLGLHQRMACADVPGPSASAGATISNVQNGWGMQGWVENEQDPASDDPDTVGQGSPYLYIHVPGSRGPSSKLAGVKSTVVFYYSGLYLVPSTTPQPLLFDATLSVGDEAHRPNQHAQSSVSSAPGVAAATESGNDGMAEDHIYGHSQVVHFDNGSRAGEERQEQDFSMARMGV